MKLLVYLRDGRTVFRISGRGVLAQLVGRDPWHEERGAVVDRGIWNATTGEYVWTPAIRMRFLSKGSISYVEEDKFAYAAGGMKLPEPAGPGGEPDRSL